MFAGDIEYKRYIPSQLFFINDIYKAHKETKKYKIFYNHYQIIKYALILYVSVLTRLENDFETHIYL